MDGQSYFTPHSEGQNPPNNRPPRMTMDMGDVEFAELSEGTLNQIRKLEHSLRRETQRDIYLLAYEKPNDSPIPRH